MDIYQLLKTYDGISKQLFVGLYEVEIASTQPEFMASRHRPSSEDDLPIVLGALRRLTKTEPIDAEAEVRA